MNNRNLVFLRHILDEIEFINDQFKGLQFQDLMENPVLQRATVRSLEVIGEAVKNLSEDFKQAHPEVEWKRFGGLRDKLIHHYFGIDWEIVWDVITNRLSFLEDKIKKVLEKESGG